ncbi:YciI family protein [Maridesulfovibrio bastinii]|jgi:uncharacterized protein YciI|uniref:YciI family protein n=1 Tax=Maridesulfovibrio bastinii TaxID=47157 RepID=UPI0003FC9319|nr:YciI family protein [Maridesulfovibrio bastinii]
MFIVSLNYKCETCKIDEFLAEHIEYLNKQYSLKHFIASGRKNPRTGGIILARVETQEELLDILKNDPFKREDLADYTIQEFIPTMVADGLESLLETLK